MHIGWGSLDLWNDLAVFLEFFLLPTTYRCLGARTIWTADCLWGEILKAPEEPTLSSQKTKRNSYGTENFLTLPALLEVNRSHSDVPSLSPAQISASDPMGQSSVDCPHWTEGRSQQRYVPTPGHSGPCRMEPSWLSPPCTRDPLTPAPIHILLKFNYLILFMWNMKMVLKVRGAQNCTLRECDSTSLFYPISTPPFFPCLVFWSPFKHLCCKQFTHTSNGRKAILS